MNHSKFHKSAKCKNSRSARARYNNKDNLSAAMIVGGVDKSGAHLYSIPLGGTQAARDHRRKDLVIWYLPRKTSQGAL